LAIQAAISGSRLNQSESTSSPPYTRIKPREKLSN
jgi:hypothetical protein